MILGAVYMLHMAARVIWGPLKVPGDDTVHEQATTVMPQRTRRSTRHDDRARPRDRDPRDRHQRPRDGDPDPAGDRVIVLGVCPTRS